MKYLMKCYVVKDGTTVYELCKQNNLLESSNPREFNEIGAKYKSLKAINNRLEMLSLSDEVINISSFKDQFSMNEFSELMKSYKRVALAELEKKKSLEQKVESV